jgi:phosphinothricin acetyltransferase
MDFTIRPAEIGDVPAITDIYNHAVLNSTATFDTEPKSIEDREEWFREHGTRYPVIVAESGNNVLGFASLSRYSSKAAYAATAELSVYVHPDHRGNGIGRELATRILADGKAADVRAVLSRIAADNEVSVHLHHRLDFFLVGTMKAVGVKFGRVLDVHLYEKLL